MGNNKKRKYSGGKENTRQKDRKFSNDRKDRRSSDHKTNGVSNDCLGRYLGQENDLGWYTGNAQLVHDAARIPFGNPTGLKYMLDAENTFEVNPPAICVLDTLPVPGISADSVSPINLAASGLYQYTRKNLSTTANYMMADQFMVNLAIDGLFTLWSHIWRLFGMTGLYSARNLNINKNLVCAIYNWQESAWDDFLANLADYRVRFNNLITEASTLYMPNSFSISKRHAWMFQNYFADADSMRAQFYAYRPTHVYGLNETEFDTGTSLQPIDIRGIGPKALLDRFKDLINRLRSSDLAQMVMADERRAFNDQDYFTLAYVTEDFAIVPNLSKEALVQLHNTVIFGIDGLNEGDEYNLWVTQDVNHNTIRFNPTFNCSEILDWYEDNNPTEHDRPTANDLYTFLSNRVFLDSNVLQPNEGEVTLMTRNINTLTDYQSTAQYAKFSSINSEIVTGATFFGARWAEQGEVVSRVHSNLIMRDNSTLVTALSNFDWAPVMWIPTGDASHLGRHYLPVGDINCFTTVDATAIANLNNNIQMSMWNVPELGVFPTNK